MGFFPPINILNRYYIGDTVMLVPIAEHFSRINGSVMLQSKYAELLRHHPNIIAVGMDEELPSNTRTLEMTSVLSSIPEDGENSKLADIYKLAGMEPKDATPPRLYLSHHEQLRVNEIRDLFSGTNVGVVLSSRANIKNWPYTRFLLKSLTRQGYNVFVFGEGIGFHEKRLLKKQKVFKVVDKTLREAMVWIAAMDALVGPDTGLLHVAGALQVPIVVVAWQEFKSLYDPYESCIVLPSKKARLNTVSVRKVSKAIKSVLASAHAAVEPRVLLARFRGLGDILMTLPALATLRSEDGTAEYVYATSPAGATLLRGTQLVDKAVPMAYSHADSGLPRLPDDLDIEDFSVVHNLINRVDFTVESDKIPRTDMFGELLDLKKVDYSLDWKIKPLYSWKRGALSKLYKAGLGYGEKYMALQYTSAGWSRMWPRERFLEFVSLAMEAGHKVVILSDVTDQELPEGAINVTGQLTLAEYIGVIAESKILIGPDSSGVHLAGCMDKLAIGLYGSVDPRLRIAHYDTVSAIVGKEKCTPCNDAQKHSCRDDPHRPVCLWNIDPKEILDKVESLLSREKP